MSSRTPFGVTVWAWGTPATGTEVNGNVMGIFTQGTSYAYPAGMSVKPITPIVVPPTLQ
jgi:hypothetical protein